MLKIQKDKITEIQLNMTQEEFHLAYMAIIKDSIKPRSSALSSLIEKLYAIDDLIEAHMESKEKR